MQKLSVLAVALLTLAGTGDLDAQISSERLESLKARAIGPAGMSGRVTAIATEAANEDVIYVGTASGGLWKSLDGGISWKPIFDDQPIASIGALAIDPSNPDRIWAGTGEGNPRNSQTVGRGLYRSLDAGSTWELVGLRETEHIHRIVIDARHPDTVYAAALGKTWGENQQRGVYKTTDGGQDWERVLYVDERTGAADLVMDPRNPDKLIAAMWEHRRWPWAFKSGGPGSGLYITHDGGRNWVRRTSEDGLPEGDLGRIGLAVADNRPDIVYALIESKKNALYRSDDGGVNWAFVSDDEGIGNRPFYYFDLFVDPSNENRLFSLHSGITTSEDGGKTWSRIANGIHSDHHAFWVSRNNPRYMIEGNDGGLSISRDGGAHWRFVRNLPLAQFYHVNVDMDRPFNVYGGLQDNGSWTGPSHVWGRGGIRSSHWRNVGFGDGFDVAPDSQDNRWVYSMSQGGNLRRYDSQTGVSRTIRPPDPPDTPLRFHWNAGLATDPFDPAALYYGSQFLHRSPDRGNTWVRLSEDLTTNDPEKQKQLDSGGLTFDVTGAEDHTTILAIAPSPKDPNVIWVGTDDGNVQVTPDGGRSWRNVVAAIDGVPPGAWVPHIEASKFDPAEAFVVFEDHRRSNWTPYIFRTRDMGATWTSLVTPEIDGFVHVIEQDPIEPRLLFLGTEFHLYFSVDAGESWTQLESGLPTVAFRDLVVHPRDHDLVAATFGRAIFIIDDINPLRELAAGGAALLDAPLHLFAVADAVLAQRTSLPQGGVIFPGDADFAGDNRPFGALITYVVNGIEPEDANPDDSDADEAESNDRITIEILDSEGTVIKKLSGPAESGLHRISWALDHNEVRGPSTRRPGRDGRQQEGRPVLPGTYTVRVSAAEEQQSQPVKVIFDPRQSIPAAEMIARDQLRLELEGITERAAEAFARLKSADEQLDRLFEVLKESSHSSQAHLEKEAEQLRSRIKSLRAQVNAEAVQGIRRDPALLGSILGRARSYAGSTWAAPSDSDRQVVGQAGSATESFVSRVNEFLSGQWEPFREQVAGLDLEVLGELKPVG